jgi:hypothetical protein
MKKLTFIILMFFTSVFSFSQDKKPVSVFVSPQISFTLYDRTISNNSIGWGFLFIL